LKFFKIPQLFIVTVSLAGGFFEGTRENIFHIFLALALITFIYAIIGMTLFGHVKHQAALNDQVINYLNYHRLNKVLTEQLLEGNSRTPRL
jgi:hypothetical protein